MSEAVTDMSSELRTAFGKWPAFPNQKALGALGHFGDGGADLRRGKELQEELGVYLIPMQCNCEIGAGLWDRITNGAWRSVLGTKAALAAAPPNIINVDDPQADDATHLHAGDENDIARWGRIKKELARIPELEAQLAQMRETLEAKAAVFDKYAELHQAKGTREGAHKSHANRIHYAECRAALDYPTQRVLYRDQIRREALEEAAKAAEGMLRQFAVEKGNTKTSGGRTAIFYKRKVSTAIRSLAGGE